MPPKDKMKCKERSTRSQLQSCIRKRESTTDTRVALGDAKATAYFNAMRINHSKRRKVPKNKVDNKEQTNEIISNSYSVEESRDQFENNKNIKDIQFPSQRNVDQILNVTDKSDKIQDNGRFNELFPIWRNSLLAGYNLLLRGIGSKMSLLKLFAAEQLSDSVVVEIHGYLPSVSIRSLIHILQKDILHIKKPLHRSIIQECQDISCQSASSISIIGGTRIVLLVHAIDSVSMRNPEMQIALSWLATAGFISVIASSEHLNCSLLWSESEGKRFQWINHIVHTYIPYQNEVVNAIQGKTSLSEHSDTGIKYILQSLTPTDMSTLKILATMQVDIMERSDQRSQKRPSKKILVHGVDSQNIYAACRKQMVHTTLLSMRNSIKCLEEHGLIKRIRDVSREKLEIPMKLELIKKIILETCDKKI